MDNEFVEKMNVTGFTLLQFEAHCYLRYIKLLILLYKQKKPSKKYGNEEGFDSYMGISATLDFSVFLYEALKFFKDVLGKKMEEFSSPEFLKNLEVIRNNIHLYYKSGGYSTKADEIIQRNIKEFKMEKRDILYPLRNDIALVFIVENNERKLIGSNQFAYHCIYETDEKVWEGERYKEYSANLSSMIKGISDAFDDTMFQLPEFKQNCEIPCIELFDYKSSDLYYKIDVSDANAFRLMLSLTQLSYSLILSKNIIDEIIISESELWELFITKLLAIKYDEAFDNIQSILEHSGEHDQAVLKSILYESNVNIGTLRARHFAQKLRNTIHYKNIQIDTSLCLDNTTLSWIRGIFLTNSGTKSIDEFREYKAIMLEEMYHLQTAIRKSFSLDKRY